MSAKVNNLRRTIGVLLRFGPFALIASSLVYGLLHESSRVAGLALAAAAILIALLNFYLSFFRGWLFLLRHSNLDGYKHVSGFPVVGTLLVLGFSGFWVWRNVDLAAWFGCFST